MSYGMYLGRNRTHFKGVLKVQKDSKSWKIISWHCHDWRRAWLPRTQYFKIMTEQTKKQAQQKPCSADDINSSGPPAQLGITGSESAGRNTSDQSQVTVFSLCGEKRLLGKWNDLFSGVRPAHFPEIFHVTYATLSQTFIALSIWL